MATFPVSVDAEQLDLSAESLEVPVRARTACANLSSNRVLLVATLALATLSFGAVEAWAWGLTSILAGVALLLWVWTAVDRGAVRLLWTPLCVPAASFLLVAFVQYAGGFTADPLGTREALVKLIADVTIFFLACELWQGASLRELRRLGFAVTLFATGLALFATLQFFASPGTLYGVVKPRWGGWIFGPYVNHNHYAGLMEMLIPVALGYLIAPRSRRPELAGSLLARILGPLAVSVALASVLLSGSRGGMISLAVEAVIMAVIAGPRLPRERCRALAIAGIVSVMASAALFLWLDPGRIWRRLGTVADLPRAPEATLGQRRELTRDALRIFRTHPWLGTGLGSFATVYPRYRSFASDLEWDHAHDDYAEALAETGIAGGAAIIVAICLFLANAFHGLDSRLQRRDGWIRLGAAIGCCGLLAHSLGDFNLHIPANAAWLAFFAGIAVCHTGSAVPGKRSDQAWDSSDA